MFVSLGQTPVLVQIISTTHMVSRLYREQMPNIESEICLKIYKITRYGNFVVGEGTSAKHTFFSRNNGFYSKTQKNSHSFVKHIRTNQKLCDLGLRV